MAGFRTHITVSSGLGGVYGGVAVQPMNFSTETAVLAAGLTAVGGMLPDLDSDSGVPVREMFGLAAAVVPLMAIPRLNHMGISLEGRLAFILFAYLIIRYGVSRVFKHLTVHRGMYHSIPAMLIAGLLVFLAYSNPTHPDRPTRVLLAVGVMVGFLSHLVLDEIYSVNFNGVRFKLKASAGSAVKLFSPSFAGNVVCYLLLGALCYLAYRDVSPPP